MAECLHGLLLHRLAGVVQRHVLEHVLRAVGLAPLAERRDRLAADVERGVVTRDVSSTGNARRACNSPSSSTPSCLTGWSRSVCTISGSTCNGTSTGARRPPGPT